ncbi:XVIPCD domain-containing protein [Luteimonas sp. MC1572]|uniref:XVIPCD domain-containing protein n=1 Tax=Luteimonas sp. MC1572 TaxID=2799325 RepID=UPI0018F0B778|nr:XVIPCD domain-containing protein [Luteimonas sp. MC1572]MBJ6982703.1 peptidoglycan-binding protein [Luteimonas sp. MC1572]QQO03944.1 peptidoglycan-binding protein [Luteimonas sp. MC1572]
MTQYALADPAGPPRNIGVKDLESLVTHHPRANRRGQFLDGVPKDVEHADKRSYAVIGAELQEVQSLRTDKQYRSVAPDQVLLIKDFILDDPTVDDSRRVDVPAPAAGIVGRVDARNGVVDILDPADRALIVRIRHLGPIAVEVGEHIAYGQALGTQNNIGLPRSAGKHVHIEMDTRHYQQFDHYVRDLVEGRLPVAAAHRAGIEPRPVLDDGVMRVGESGERVSMVQRALVAGGYRAVGDAPIAVDGVYRLSMQGAVLAFQQANSLAPTGDIDPPTWRAALDIALGRPALPPPVLDSMSPPGLPRGQFRLLDQIRDHLRNNGARLGDMPDADGERLALALAGRAAQQGLSSADHVLFAQSAAGASRGARMVVVQGRLDDPAQHRISLSVADALATSPAESLRRLQGLEAPGLAAMSRAPAHQVTADAHPVVLGI